MDADASRQALNRQSIWLIRILGIITAVIVPPFRYILLPNSYDPMWMRWSISGLVMAFVLSSFWYDGFNRHARLISNAVAFLITGWMLYLAGSNALVQEYTASYFIMLFASIILFKDRRWLIAFILFHCLAVVFSVFFIPNPVFNPVTFVSMVASIMFIGSIGQWTGVVEYQQSIKQGARLRTLNQTALANSNEGIIVTDPFGQIQRSNPVFGVLFDLPHDKVLSLEVWLQAVQRQMVEPALAMRLAKTVTQEPEIEMTEQFHLINGKHVRLLTKPIHTNDHYDGRIWFFKDVTQAHLQREAMLQQQNRLQRQNDMLTALSIDVAMQSGELEVVAPIVVTETALSLLADRASIWRWDAKTELLHCQAQYHAKSGILDNTDDLSAKDNPDFFQLIATTRVLVIDDAYKNPLTASFYANEPTLLHPLQLLQVPLKLGGKLYGLLSVARETAAQKWTVDDQQFMSAIGDLLVISLEAGERRKAEVQLAKSGALLKAVFELAGVGILVTRTDRTVIDCNNTYLSLFGMTRAFIMEEHADTVVDYCRSLMIDEAEANKSMRFLKDHPSENESRTVYFKNGRIVERYTEVLRVDLQIIGRVWFYRDVTEATNADRYLRASEIRNLSIIQAIPDLMLRLSAQGDILDIKIPEIWAASALIIDARATKLVHLFPLGFANEIMELTSTVLDQKKAVAQELALELTETIRDIETRLSPSGIGEVLIMLRDVTERKKTEKELIQRNHELDSFVYRASHDLKAPLNSLMGLIDIVKTEEHPPELDTYLKLMDRSVLKLDTFVRNLTDFTRINRLALQSQPVDFEALLGEANEGLRYMQNANLITQRLEITQDATFFGDNFHLGIVIANLLSNAIKYYDPKKPTPFVHVIVHSQENACTIAVTDNGLGIPKIHQDKIFDLFFRATNQSFGSGLGLYITRNAIEKMEGSIAMDSEEGRGTTFTITLPNRMQKAKTVSATATDVYQHTR